MDTGEGGFLPHFFLFPFTFFLLPFLRGDRPPGSQPGGMSKIKFRSFPQNVEIIPNRRAYGQLRRFHFSSTELKC